MSSLIEDQEKMFAYLVGTFQTSALINTLSDLKIKLIEQKSIIKSSEKKTQKES